MSDEMWALAFDRSKSDWDKSRGLGKVRVPKPVLDESRNPLDAERVIIKVHYTGFCGSDKGIWNRNAFKDMIFGSLDEEGKDYRVTGHELLGEVAEAGSLAEKHYGFRPGDMVTTESHITCGKCLQCRIGQREVCQNELIIGFSLDGCFAQYIKLPAKVLWKSDPNKIRPEVGAIQEPFGNAVHACTKVDLRGKSLAVFGCGTIGLFTILTARALGVSKIIGVEPKEENARLAERIGADEVIRFEPKDGWRSDPGVVTAVREFGGDGVDVAIEMAGYNSSVNNALRSVRMGGEVVLFGIKTGDFQIERLDRVIVAGVTMYSVIGRRIFETWNISTNLLEARENQIQDRIFDVILDKGKDTVIPITDFDPDDFERRFDAHPKVIIKWI
ncbi:MAG: alcohol dehydrogenase catalytic domain-containing protein [Candidatus Latescibacterota bacterium]|nr:MAG: alcohol dehydrogenase catalytic domain-containing protein [Candidatus Latescibacterota bacterium]